VPGDVVDYLYGLYMGSGRMDEIRALWGLDRPLVIQYLDWLGQCFPYCEKHCNMIGIRARIEKNDCPLVASDLTEFKFCHCLNTVRI